MIEQLRISGVGVIDQALLDLSPGLTVITGETGAGKTMILNALRLLMGEKGDSELVRAGHKRIEVDGYFLTGPQLREKLESLGIEVGEETIVSRTVPAEGRSRAVVEGRPVPLRTLEELVSPLVTIHGQSDQWRVRRPQVQRDILDQYAGRAHLKDLDLYRKQWQRAVELKDQLDVLHGEHDQRQVELQYLEELVEAIDELDPLPTEEEDLERQIDRFNHVADLVKHVSSALASLRGFDTVLGVLDHLGEARSRLRQAGGLDDSLELSGTRLEQVETEIADVADVLRDYLETLREDPDELSRLQQRRSDLESLMKGRATTVKELLEWREEARVRLEELTGEESNPEHLAAELADVQLSIRKIGAALMKSRANAAKKLAGAVNGELTDLAMAQASFRVSVKETTPQPYGIDRVQMELRGRPGAPYRALGEGASGGEISRVMLALEVALGEQSAPGTYIFDEVDQGIGGHTATEVGRRLAKLSENQQVIAVTHLPQVAVFADRHLVLRKDGVKTVIEEADGERRVDEIVRMLGADLASPTARRHAGELLAGEPWEDREGHVTGRK